MKAKTMKGAVMMCVRLQQNNASNRAVYARAERYRRYAAEKARIPLNLKPYEYEQEIRRLARKYKV